MADEINKLIRVTADTSGAESSISKTNSLLEELLNLQKKQGDGAKTAADTIASSSDKSTGGILKQTNAMGQLDKLTGGFASSAVSFVKGIYSMVTATNLFTLSLAATGIPLIIGAVALLIDYFKTFAPVVDIVEQAMAAFGAAVKVVQQALVSLLSGDLSGFKNLAGDIQEAAEASIALKKAQQDLEDLKEQQEVSNARADADYNKLILQSKNRTLSEKERLKFLQEAAKVEAKNFEERKAIAAEDLRQAQEAIRIAAKLTKAEFAELQKRGLNYKEYVEKKTNDSDELFKALQKAELGQIANEDENTKRAEKNQNAQDKLAADQEKKAEKAAEAAQKRRDDEIKRREEHNNKVKALEQRLIDDVNALNDKSAQDKLDRQMAKDRAEIDALRLHGDEKLRVEAEFNEKYKILQNNINEQNEKDRQDFLAAVREGDKTSQENLKQEQLDLLAGGVAEVAEVENKETKTKEENAAAQKKIEDLKEADRKKKLDAVKSGLGTLATLLGESTAGGKAAAIAMTTIDTIQSGVSAFKGMISAIPGPVGIALGAVAAAGVAASGYASVKKILAVKTPGKGGGGAAGAPSAPPSLPKFNVVGSSQQSQLSESIASQQNAPVRNYVVASDVTTQQSLDRNIVSNATFG